MGFTIILIAVISKGFENIRFHNMFSFCCTRNLLLGAQLSLVPVSALVLWCLCSSDLHSS